MDDVIDWVKFGGLNDLLPERNRLILLGFAKPRYSIRNTAK
jgi:hypothetical protein